MRAVSGTFKVTVFVANRAIGKLALSSADSGTCPKVLYRGMSGRVRIPFRTMYNKEDNVNQGSLGRLADCALFSTTKDLAVATGSVYGGEIVFLLSQNDELVKEGHVNEAGFRAVCSPAPVRWISQFPGEEEFLWPTNTALIPKLPSHRCGLAVAGREVYEFTPIYLWDTRLRCVGRWRDIESSEMEMAKMAVKLSSRGIGMQDAYMAIPGLLVDNEVDEDFEPEEAISIGFSLFDLEGTGAATWDAIESLLRFFYSEIMERPPAEMESVVHKITLELKPLVRPDDGLLHWKDFRAHLLKKNLTKF